MTVIAHLGGGHWWEIGIYLVPLVFVGLAVLREVLRGRKETKSKEAERSKARRPKR